VIEMEPTNGNGVPAMTNNQLLRELYADMKIVKPAVLGLGDAKLPDRVNALESWKDQLTGRLAAAAVALGVVFTILGLILDHVVVRS
jgi:hypothetical protein